MALQRLTGEGRLPVSTACELARAGHVAGAAGPTLEAFASAGLSGAFPSNMERDLHRRLQRQGMLEIMPYVIPVRLREFPEYHERAVDVHVYPPHEAFHHVPRRLPLVVPAARSATRS
jgi:hypothetical protein